MTNFSGYGGQPGHEVDQLFRFRLSLRGPLQRGRDVDGHERDVQSALAGAHVVELPPVRRRKILRRHEPGRRIDVSIDDQERRASVARGAAGSPLSERGLALRRHGESRAAAATPRRGLPAVRPLHLHAMTAISTLAPFGRAATCTAVRAGYFPSRKYPPYTEIHLRIVTHVRQIDNRAHDLARIVAGGPEDASDVVQDLPGFGFDVVVPECACLRVQGDLPGDEQKTAGANGGRIGPDHRGGFDAATPRRPAVHVRSAGRTPGHAQSDLQDHRFHVSRTTPYQAAANPAARKLDAVA